MDTFSTLLETLLVKFLTFLPRAIVAMVILFVGLYLAGLVTKVVKRALDRRETDREIKLVLTQLTRWTLITLAVFVALQQIGFDVTTFLVSLGVVGFTIGFALQDISKNFVAGILLLLQQPFEIGNLIEVDSYLGQVLNVDLRATELQTIDGRVVLIPNADVYTQALINYSRQPNRRLSLKVGVAYGSDLAFVRQVVLNAIERIPQILSNPAPQVIFSNLGDSSVDFTVYFWINTAETALLEITDVLLVAIYEAFSEKNIEIPYPIQTVLLKS